MAFQTCQPNESQQARWESPFLKQQHKCLWELPLIEEQCGWYLHIPINNCNFTEYASSLQDYMETSFTHRPHQLLHSHRALRRNTERHLQGIRQPLMSSVQHRDTHLGQTRPPSEASKDSGNNCPGGGGVLLCEVKQLRRDSSVQLSPKTTKLLNLPGNHGCWILCGLCPLSWPWPLPLALTDVTTAAIRRMISCISLNNRIRTKIDRRARKS